MSFRIIDFFNEIINENALLSLQNSWGIKTSIGRSIGLGARELGKVIFIKTSIDRRIDLGAPELGKPERSFILRLLLTEAWIWELLCSGGPTSHFY